ncbi:MAG: hypothetical protein HYZ00_01025 [Candidatus Hydrogenedentes bacterium]|nr:hypothetical protein [Candidatus Hydrogenedentota bacterium]
MAGEPVRVLPGEKPRKSNTCLVGCIGVVLVIMVFTFVAVFVGVYAFSQLREAFTSDAPAPVPQVQYTDQQAQEVQQRLQQFENALDAGAGATLELTPQDLNILLRSDPRSEFLANSVYLDIVDNALTAEVSMPLDMFPGMSGRYLNGSIGMDIDVVNDRLVVSLEKLTVRGREFPGQVLSQFEGELNKGLTEDAEVRKFAQKIESIAVENGQLRVTLKEGA